MSAGGGKDRDYHEGRPRPPATLATFGGALAGPGPVDISRQIVATIQLWVTQSRTTWTTAGDR